MHSKGNHIRLWNATEEAPIAQHATILICLCTRRCSDGESRMTRVDHPNKPGSVREMGNRHFRCDETLYVLRQKGKGELGA